MCRACPDERILIPVHHFIQSQRLAQFQDLEMSFAKLWIMVIGLKSAGQFAPTFFGSSTIKALLSLVMFLLFPLVKACIASMTSC